MKEIIAIKLINGIKSTPIAGVMPCITIRFSNTNKEGKTKIPKNIIFLNKEDEEYINNSNTTWNYFEEKNGLFDLINKKLIIQ